MGFKGCDKLQMMREILNNKWLKIGLLAVGGLILAISLFFVGYKLGQRQAQLKLSKRPTPKPVVTPFPIPTPDLTVDWRTYTNGEYNFEFKYPNNKYVVVEDDETKYSERVNTKVREEFEKFLGYPPPRFLFALKIVDKAITKEAVTFDEIIKVWIFDNVANKNIDTWYNDYWYYPFKWGVAVPEIIEDNRPKLEIKINERIGRYTYLSEMGGEIKYIYLPYDGKIFLFRVRVSFDELKKQEVSGVSGFILSTFRFLE